MKVLLIYTSIHHRQLQGVYDLFGYFYDAQGDLTDAVKYELLALKTTDELKDSTMQNL